MKQNENIQEEFRSVHEELKSVQERLENVERSTSNIPTVIETLQKIQTEIKIKSEEHLEDENESN